jgi:hypothetical protein
MLAIIHFVICYLFVLYKKMHVYLGEDLTLRAFESGAEESICMYDGGSNRRLEGNL